MKPILKKSISTLIVLSLFVMTAMTPPLPNYTTIRITDLPTSYYQIKIEVDGYTTDYQSYNTTVYSAVPFNNTSDFPLTAILLSIENTIYEVFSTVYYKSSEEDLGRK